MTDLAIQKLDAEQKAFKGDKYGSAVYRPVAEKLRDFCRQNDEFAQAVYQSDATLSDCVGKIMNGCGNSISDMEVYSRAVAFYFKGAKIRVQMKIDLCGEVLDEAAAAAPEEKKQAVVIDLFDLL